MKEKYTPATISLKVIINSNENNLLICIKKVILSEIIF